MRIAARGENAGRAVLVFWTALAILAEILAVRAGRGGGPLRDSKNRIHVEVA